MKTTIILLVFLALILNSFSQIPDGFSYQAIVRGEDKALLQNQSVTIKATILRNDEVIFTQKQAATTNENGLFTVIIGNEDFQTINWTDGVLYIKTQIDPLGGDNYTIETETQLLSVPYAMAAQTVVKVPELDLLIEKVNRLEDEVEELRIRVEELEGEEPIYKQIAKGALFGNGEEVITKQDLVIKTTEEWENLITAMNSVNNVSLYFTETDIDFSKYQIAAIFEEVKPSGGWSIDITDVKIEYDKWVNVKIKNLNKGDHTDVFTQPFHIAKIAVPDKKIYFIQDTDAVSACGVYDIVKNLPWLAKWINDAEINEAGGYEGWIWLEEYVGVDVFVTNMSFWMGHRYAIFDCSGKLVTSNQNMETCYNPLFPNDPYAFIILGDNELFNYFITHLKKNVLVYSNLPY